MTRLSLNYHPTEYDIKAIINFLLLQSLSPHYPFLWCLSIVCDVLICCCTRVSFQWKYYSAETNSILTFIKLCDNKWFPRMLLHDQQEDDDCTNAMVVLSEIIAFWFTILLLIKDNKMEKDKDKSSSSFELFGLQHLDTHSLFLFYTLSFITINPSCFLAFPKETNRRWFLLLVCDPRKCKWWVLVRCFLNRMLRIAVLFINTLPGAKFRQWGIVIDGQEMLLLYETRMLQTQFTRKWSRCEELFLNNVRGNQLKNQFIGKGSFWWKKGF